MPMRFHFGRDQRTKAPVMFVQTMPEAADVMALMRNLHRVFPNEWAAVHMEVVVPEDKALILNGDLPK